jgi:hypothetical protein
MLLNQNQAAPPTRSGDRPDRSPLDGAGSAPAATAGTGRSDRDRTGLEPGSEERITIERHLRANAHRYGSGPADDPEILLLRLCHRPAARLYWYRIGGQGSARTVVIKVPGAPADSPAAGEAGRPRMVEPPSLATKYIREHQALDLLQRHFSGLGDPRFGVVPLLDRIDPARAIVMGEIEGRSLNELVPQLSRMRPGRPSPLLRRAIRSAGAWLREYHQLELEGAVPRQARREDFVTNAHRYCGHLAKGLSRPGFFDHLAEQLTMGAERLFPPALPLGLGHGDFATRNVLVGRNGEIFVFDTTAVWRIPVFADLAKFALALRLSRVQVYTQGAAFAESILRRVNRWLFEGYYGSDPVPEAGINLYSLLLLLDKWSFELALPARGPFVACTVRRRLLDSWYTRQARQLMSCLAELPAAPRGEP